MLFDFNFHMQSYLNKFLKSNCPPSCSQVEWSHLPKLWYYLSNIIYSLNHSSIETYKPNKKKYTEISVHACVYTLVTCREFTKFTFFFFKRNETSEQCAEWGFKFYWFKFCVKIMIMERGNAFSWKIWNNCWIWIIRWMDYIVCFLKSIIWTEFMGYFFAFSWRPVFSSLCLRIINYCS